VLRLIVATMNRTEAADISAYIGSLGK